MTFSSTLIRPVERASARERARERESERERQRWIEQREQSKSPDLGPGSLALYVKEFGL